MRMRNARARDQRWSLENILIGILIEGESYDDVVAKCKISPALEAHIKRDQFNKL